MNHQVHGRSRLSRVFAAAIIVVAVWSGLGQRALAQTGSSLLPSAASLRDATQWKDHTGTWTPGPGSHAVRGENGLLLASTPDPADFTVVVEMRYDELRFFARPPFSGIAFHAVDRRNYDAIVLAGDESELAWKAVRDGHETVLATSTEGIVTDVGKPFWMRLSISHGTLEGALSSDGRNWKVLLQAPLRSSAALGRSGLIAGLPGTWFTWGDDAKEPLPAFQPYVYETQRKPPATLDHAPVKADYLKALQALKSVPIIPGDGIPEEGLSSLRAWQVTQDDAWKRRAIAAAKKMIAAYRTNGSVPVGFPSFYQEMTTLKAAMDQGWLTDDERAVVPQIAKEALTRGAYERGPMNRALGNLVGIRPALTLAPDYAERAKAELIVKLVEEDFAKYGYSPVEDASDYIKVSLQFAAIDALEARPDWWKEKGFHDVFYDFANEISPLGRFPGFGDDDDADPLELVGILELSAAKWGDPVFHEAARRLWAASWALGVPSTIKSSEITSIALAATYAADTPPAAYTEPDLTLLYRADGDPTKAILKNGSTWMMVDLFAGGEHGHNDSLAVTTLESNGIVQLEDNGRYARGMMFHNRPQFTIHPQDFPLRPDLSEQTRRIRQNYFTPGEWTYYHLPLHDHWIWGNFAGDIGLPTLQRDAQNPEIPAPLSYDPANQTALIFDLRGNGSGRISIADAHIETPDGSRPLALRVPAGAPPAQVHPAAFEGKDVTTWDTPVGPANRFVGAIAPGSTDAAAARHSWLDFWLRIDPTPNSKVEINSIALGDRDGYPKRWIDGMSPNGTITITGADTVDGGAHVAAAQEMISQQDETIHFTRDIYMALPGFVWVRDTMQNSGSHSGTAGVLWYGVKPVAAGKDEVHFATGLDLHLLGAQKTGIDERQSYGMRDQGIAFGSVNLQAKTPAVMDSILTTGDAHWHKVAATGEAVVWSDGVHWVGRNPAGEMLHFDGLQTDHKLFMLTRQP